MWDTSIGCKEARYLCCCLCVIATLTVRRVIIGKTTATASDEDLSVDVLANDLVQLLQVIFSNPKETPSLLVSAFCSALWRVPPFNRFLSAGRP